VRLRIAATVAAFGLLVAGCSSSGAPKAGGGGASSSAIGVSGGITVFAAASLTESFATIGRRFEAAHPGTKITFKFDASSTLATQITEGNAADVFASAAAKNMDAVAQAGDAVEPRDFASNTMEIATPPGNPARISSVTELAKPSVKVALCEPAVPCGATAQRVFDNAKITVKPVSREPDVKSTLAKVELKEVDAGVVYVSDVRAAGARVSGVQIAADVNASTTYPISVLKKSKNAPLANAFVDYVLSDDGQQVLREAGFSAP
jgi:molybdate transport system substrate-binding protein